MLRHSPASSPSDIGKSATSFRLRSASSLPSCGTCVAILEAGEAGRCASIADLFKMPVLDVIKPVGEAALDAKLGQLFPILN